MASKKRRKSPTRKSTGRKSAGTVGALFETLWKLLEDNPQVALAIAFEIGALLNEATKSRGNVKKMLLKQLGQGADLLPQLLAGAHSKVPSSLKILAEPALRAALVARGSSQAGVTRKKRR